MEEGLGVKENISILIEDGKILKIGKIKPPSEAVIIDARGCLVMPGLIDAHTHLVFAGSRADEMVMRLQGMSYAEIAERGGGIMRTVQATRRASEEELYQQAQKNLSTLLAQGTTTLEIKSGYGLSLKDELKILKVIRRLKETNQVDVVATFLGAHVIPPGWKRKRYVEAIVEEMLPAVARQGLADFCDVFMEEIAFHKKETEAIFKTARSLGLGLKIHADELTNCKGAELAGRFRTTSADHLIYTDREGIDWLKRGGVVPVLLPGTALFLKIRKKPDIPYMLKRRLPVTIASDFNPGTCMVNSMFLIIGLACFLYDLPLEDALLGATINAARALRLDQKLGSLKVGKQADILILGLKDYREIPYRFGHNFIKSVIKKGVVVYEQDR